MPIRLPYHMLYACPKTGSTFARRAAREHYGQRAETPGGGHDPRKDWLAWERAGRHAVGTMRNPWAWYVSWWHHCRDNTRGRDLERIGAGSTAFRDVLYGATHQRWAKRPGVIADLGDESTARKVCEPRGWGLCTWAHRYTYGGGVGGAPIHLIDCDRVAEGMGEVFGDAQHWRDRPAANTRWQRNSASARDRTPYPDLYDDEMLAWVAEADAELIVLGGYAPFEPAQQAVTLAHWEQVA